jgi:hypothetical protein
MRRKLAKKVTKNSTRNQRLLNRTNSGKVSRMLFRRTIHIAHRWRPLRDSRIAKLGGWAAFRGSARFAALLVFQTPQVGLWIPAEAVSIRGSDSREALRNDSMMANHSGPRHKKHVILPDGHIISANNVNGAKPGTKAKAAAAVSLHPIMDHWTAITSLILNALRLQKLVSPYDLLALALPLSRFRFPPSVVASKNSVRWHFIQLDSARLTL